MLLSVRLSEKEKRVSELQAELAELRDSLELHKKKNNVGFLQPELYNTSNCSDLKPCETSSPPVSCVVPQNTPYSAYIHTSCCPLPLGITCFCFLFFLKI